MKVEDIDKVQRLISDRKRIECTRDEFLKAAYIMLRPSGVPGSSRDGEFEAAKQHSPDQLTKKLYDAVGEAIEGVLTAERDRLTRKLEAYGVTD